MPGVLFLLILNQVISPARSEASRLAKQPSISRSGESDSSERLTIISSDDNRLVFTVDFAPPEMHPEIIGGRTFLRFTNAGWSQPGQPDLPAKLVSFAVPRGKAPRVKVTALEESSFGGPPPLPCPKYVDDGLTPVYDSGDYRTPWPKSLWSERGRGLFRHLKYMSVLLYPVSYEGGSYRFRKRMRVEVEFVPQEDGLAPFSGYDPFDGIYGLRFINWKGQASWKAALSSGKAPPDPFSAAAAWVKVSVREPGIYEVRYEDMLGLGVAPALLSDPNGLAVFSIGNDTMRSDTGGKEPAFPQVSARVDDGGDGVFGPGDRVLFYAEGIPDREYDSADTYFKYWDHPYTDTVIYWVAVGFTGAPKRALSREASPSGGIPCSTSVAYAHHEKNEINLGQKGIVWVEESKLSLPQSSAYADYPFEMECKGVADGGGTVEVATVGIAGGPAGEATYQLWVNGQMVGQSTTASGLRRFYRVQVTNLREGSNTITIRLIRTDNYAKEVYLDYIDLEYNRKNEYSGECHLFFPNTYPGRYLIKGYGPRPVFVWDISDPANPVVLRNFTWDAGHLSLSDSLWRGKRIYISTFTKRPVRIRLLDLSVNLRDPSNHADYIICGPDALMEPSRALAEWRAEHLWLWDPADSAWEMKGGKAIYVRLEDVYDQFGFGMRDPVAIRNFYWYAYAYWQAPQVTYYLNMGDGSYDYKGYRTTQGNMFPPWNPWESHSLNDGPWTHEDFYLDFDGDYYQDALYGRVPARDAREAWDYVVKLKRYERGEANGPWRNRVLLVPDDEYYEGGQPDPIRDHWINTDTLQRYHIPRSIEIRHCYGIEYPMQGGMKPLWTDDFIRYFNEGNLFITMFVHGSPSQITHERLYLLSTDRDRINAGPRNAFIHVLSCKVGIFERIDPPHCIGEDWAIRPDGAMGVISTTSNASSGANRLYAEAMYDLLRDYKPHPAGEHELAGKNDPDYYLCGEPGVPIRFPPPELALTAPDTLIPGKRVEFSGSGATWPVVYPVGMDTRYLKVGQTHFGDYYSVESEDWPQYRGAVSASGDFSGSYIVPSDARKDTAGARLVVYDPSPPFGRVGIADSLYTGYPANSSDITGPAISFFMHGRELSEGEMVPPKGTVEFRVCDPSGVYIRPREEPQDGFSLMFILDEKDYDVTTSFQYDKNSDTSGFGFYDYDLSGEPEGAHTFGLRAYDNLGNVSTRIISLRVAEDELSLTDALPVPNPYSGGRLYFSYRVNLQARVRVKVFTVTGKEVWNSGEKPAGPGINYIIYTGPDVANGLYFVVFEARLPNETKKQRVIEKLLITK